MSIFKKAVSDVMDIKKFQNIIDRRLQQYDKEISQLIQKIHCLYSPEEVLRLEQEVIDRCLREYDEEACPYTKRPCNPNWEEGGGGNLEIRKRMLLRDLNDRRGRLGAAVTEANNKARKFEATLLQMITDHTEQILTQLPLDMDGINSKIIELKHYLHQQILPKYPGLEYFDVYLHGSLQGAINVAKERIVDENRLKRHVDEVEVLVKSINRLYSLEEAELLEEQVIEKTIKQYDEEATGSDHLEFRRPVLLRKIQEYRGKINETVTKFNESVYRQRDEIIKLIKDFQSQVRSKLPTSYEYIAYHFVELKVELNAKTLQIFSVRFEEFDEWLKKELSSEIETFKKQLIEEPLAIDKGKIERTPSENSCESFSPFMSPFTRSCSVFIEDFDSTIKAAVDAAKVSRDVDIFCSLRFIEAREQAHLVRVALSEYNLNAVIIDDVENGDNIAVQVAELLASAKLVLIFGTETYGKDTGSIFSTLQELQYIMARKKQQFFLIKMCQRFKEKFADFFLGVDTLSYIEWLPGAEMPPTLISSIVAKYNKVTQNIEEN